MINMMGSNNGSYMNINENYTINMIENPMNIKNKNENEVLMEIDEEKNNKMKGEKSEKNFCNNSKEYAIREPLSILEDKNYKMKSVDINKSLSSKNVVVSFETKSSTNFQQSQDINSIKNEQIIHEQVKNEQMSDEKVMDESLMDEQEMNEPAPNGEVMDESLMDEQEMNEPAPSGLIVNEIKNHIIEKSKSIIVSNSVLSLKSYNKIKISKYFGSINMRNKIKENYFYEYLDEIYGSLLEEEERHYEECPIVNYLHFQTEMNERIRGILIDWIIDLHYGSKDLTQQSLYLSIRIIDVFLSKKFVPKNKIQLVGIAAVFIATKMEEIKYPNSDYLVYITDYAYTKEELLEMENEILKTLNYNFSFPTVYDFFEIISHVFDFSKEAFYTGLYFLETFLMSYDSVGYRSSVIACGCAYIVMKYYQMDGYNICYSEILNSENANPRFIKIAAKNICSFIDGIRLTNYSSTTKKFSSNKFLKVAIKIMQN